MSKVIVVGGGASGLVSAIYSAKAGNEVLILERNEKCGKKILVTGNGRCNYFNEFQNSSCYHSSSAIDFYDIINYETNKEVLNFFESIGINPRIKKGYYYPMSNQASSIREALLTEAKLNEINIEYEVLVSNIIKEDNIFKIVTNKGVYECDKVIMATGSKAAPKTGSDGLGYDILKKLGHTIIKPLPALVQLICNDKITSYWDGVRNDSTISLYVNGEKLREEDGELMLTDYGLSGICIFNLSGIAAKALDNYDKVSVVIDFLPSLFLRDTGSAIKWIDNFNDKVKNRTISELLNGLLNYKLVNALLKKNKIEKDSYWNELKAQEKENLANSLVAYKIDVVGTNSFDKAQVCSGGVSLDEMDLNTMESRIIPNLFIVGELLDVYGDCGGYNLNWAWISGIAAGKGTGKND